MMNSYIVQGLNDETVVLDISTVMSIHWRILEGTKDTMSLEIITYYDRYKITTTADEVESLKAVIIKKKEMR